MDTTKIVSAVIELVRNLKDVWVFILGASLTIFVQKGFNRIAFIDRQIEQFYSPMVGLRRKLLALDSVNSLVGRSILDEMGSFPSEIDLAQMTDPQKVFMRDVDYTNEQLTSEILPIYEEMVRLFRDNHWLVEPATGAYEELLISFVEKVKRDLQNALPREARKALPKNDKDLEGFYAEVEETLNRFTNRKRKGWIFR